MPWREVPDDWWRYACHRIHHPLACVGPDHRFIWVNRAYEQLLGYSLSRLRHLTWKDVTVLEDVDADLESVQEVIDGRADTYTMWKRYRHRNGDEVPVELTVAKFPLVGEVVCFLVEAIPATATRQELEDFRDTTDETLEKMGEQLQALLIAHERHVVIAERHSQEMDEDRQKSSTVVQVGNNSIDVVKTVMAGVVAIVLGMLAVLGYQYYVGTWGDHQGGAEPPPAVESPLE